MAGFEVTAEAPTSLRFRLLAGQRLYLLPNSSVVLGRPAGTGRILKPFQPARHETPAPLTHRHFGKIQARRNLLIRLSGGRSEHDPAPKR